MAIAPRRSERAANSERGGLSRRTYIGRELERTTAIAPHSIPHAVRRRQDKPDAADHVQRAQRLCAAEVILAGVVAGVALVVAPRAQIEIRDDVRAEREAHEAADHDRLGLLAVLQLCRDRYHRHDAVAIR